MYSELLEEYDNDLIKRNFKVKTVQCLKDLL